LVASAIRFLPAALKLRFFALASFCFFIGSVAWPSFR
jgi:hypothetical protein